MAPYKQVKLPKPGPSALVVIASAVRDGAVTVESQQQGVAANKSVSNGYLTRDKKDGKTYYPTDRAREMLAMLEGIAEPGDMPERETETAMVPVADASGLVATVERARALLDEGDVMNARIVASVAYNQAKTAAQFAEQIGATEKLVAKARRMQADALLIEARAKILIADKWDEARAAGEVSKGGRPKPVSDGNGLTAVDTGLSRKEIHDARKLAAAEHREPGIVERAIQARLAAGLEPTKANLRAAVGTASATKEERRTFTRRRRKRCLRCWRWKNLPRACWNQPAGVVPSRGCWKHFTTASCLPISTITARRTATANCRRCRTS